MHFMHFRKRRRHSPLIISLYLTQLRTVYDAKKNVTCIIVRAIVSFNVDYPTTGKQMPNDLRFLEVFTCITGYLHPKKPNH